MRIRSLCAAAAATITLFTLASFAIACSDDDDDGAAATPAASASAATPAASSAAATPAGTAQPAPAGPVNFSVLAGHLDGNVDVEAFMPQDIRIRAGDSITWTAHGFEGHTITFGVGDDLSAVIGGQYLIPNPADPSEQMFNPVFALPSAAQGSYAGGTEMVNSGFIGVPTEATYKLTFPKEGLYIYLCMVHPFTMTGTVSVESADTPVDGPESVAAAGQADAERFTAELKDAAAAQRDVDHDAPGPDGTTIHYVQFGVITDHGQVAVYTPGSLEIDPGDTVIFQNDDRNFHNVIFKGDDPELPPGIGFVPGPNGGMNFSLDNASAVAVDPPPEGFDDTTFLSSGSMGVTLPRLTWTLRFDNPGTYVYACTIHVLAGMTGAIEVRGP